MQTTIETEVTRQIWQRWQHNSVKPNLTWIELYKLVLHTSQQCQLNGVDPQELDLLSLIDSSLNYYENLNALNVQLQQLGALSYLNIETGTQKLRENLALLRASYKHLKQRLEKSKQQNQRLKLKLKKKQRKRRRKAK